MIESNSSASMGLLVMRDRSSCCKLRTTETFHPTSGWFGDPLQSPPHG